MDTAQDIREFLASRRVTPTTDACPTSSASSPPRSDEFRVRWAAHNVKFHRTGRKRLHHPIVGDLTLGYEALDLPADSGQQMLVYTAEPGSPSHDAMQLLASWATTPAAPAVATDEDHDH